jgi:crossover junction endodeoxyribonuclease RuvC
MIILGIDPGKVGALAFYSSDTHRILKIIDMPTLNTSAVKGKTKTVISWSVLVDELLYIRDYGHFKVTHAYLEFVSSSPQMGVASSFAFGRGFGGLEALIAAFQYPLFYVTPAKWKREFGLGPDKEASRVKASLLLPADTALWTPSRREGITKAQAEGRAEAALIAVFGSRQQRSNPKKRVRL